MATCVPIRDLKDTAKFADLVESASEPITVTKNGYDTFVVMRSKDYEAMRKAYAKEQLLSVIAKAEADLAVGNYVSGDEFTLEMRAKYGI
jgi:prevent-host-death family protein